MSFLLLLEQVLFSSFLSNFTKDNLISAHFIGNNTDIITKLKEMDDYQILQVNNDEILKDNYIRYPSNQLRSFKSFRNLWERDSSMIIPSKTNDFKIWHEEYPQEIFKNKDNKSHSNTVQLPAIICIYWLINYLF